jgi:uncharacterized membrane protein YfcA
MQQIFLIFSTLTAYFVKGITGFGNTLVMGTLFSFVLSNRVITPVDLLFSIPTNAYLAFQARKSIEWNIVLPLSLTLLLGILPGVLLLKAGNDRVLKAVLGLVVAGIALEMWTRKPAAATRRQNPVFLVVIGLVSGVLAGLYGISAPLIAYISRTTCNRQQFRANLCCVFLADNVFRLILYWVNGLLSAEVWVTTLLLSPAVALGMYLGVRVDSRLSEGAVRKSIIAVLLLSGAVLFVKSILSK